MKPCRLVGVPATRRQRRPFVVVPARLSCNHRICITDYQISTLAYFLGYLSHLMRIDPVETYKATFLNRRTTIVDIVINWRRGCCEEYLHILRKSSSNRLYLFPKEWKPILRRIFRKAPKARGERYFEESDEYGRPESRDRGKGMLISRVIK